MQELQVKVWQHDVYTIKLLVSCLVTCTSKSPSHHIDLGLVWFSILIVTKSETDKIIFCFFIVKCIHV